MGGKKNATARGWSGIRERGGKGGLGRRMRGGYTERRRRDILSLRRTPRSRGSVGFQRGSQGGGKTARVDVERGLKLGAVSEKGSQERRHGGGRQGSTLEHINCRATGYIEDGLGGDATGVSSMGKRDCHGGVERGRRLNLTFLASHGGVHSRVLACVLETGSSNALP
ncbi:hypothetical protein WN55_04569 [Dufourea novaeangliae]|uniref:Uncharacterized protein n=1 Tax=Dufourea novaeangliae TaxID=178035 RepID=A0A154P113_DUFNO|nr:hypothetical protein WN55_04569 [Dufourea novaeangliae]